MDSELIHLTAHEARGLLMRHEVSSVELTQAVLSHIEKVEPRVHSLITITPELALTAAAKSDAMLNDEKQCGPLTGIPIVVKDNISTKGTLTTAGSKMLSNFIPPYDAHVVTRLREAGAIIVGKGNLDEFAMGSSNENSAFQPTRNPWNTNLVPGGSSGGPAAAVSTGECYIALGSDTGGSIRQPSALCGVVGMKPTYGLVSRYGLIAFASSLDQIGPIARDVQDCADMLTVIAGHDPRDSTSSPTAKFSYSARARTNLEGVKIGVPREYLVTGMEKGVKAAYESALQVLESLGASVTEISLPLTDLALAVYYIIAPSEAMANLARYDGFKYGHSSSQADDAWDLMKLSRGEAFGAEVKRRIILGGYALSAGYYDAYYKKAQQVRSLIRKEFSEFFQKFDVLVTPTSPTVAFKVGSRAKEPLSMYMSDICTIPANIAGLPAISVPAGNSGNLPVGLQIVGPPSADSRVISIAHSYEQATPWHLEHPPLW